MNIQIHALYFLALVCGQLNKDFLVKNILPSLKYISDQGKKTPLVLLTCSLLFSLLLSVLKYILCGDCSSIPALFQLDSMRILGVLIDNLFVTPCH